MPPGPAGHDAVGALHRTSGAVAALTALLLAAGCGSARAGSAGTGGEGGGAGGGGGGTASSPLRASAVAVGAAHSCAIVEGGAVACWGDGAHGQLGDGGSGKGYQRAVPGPVPGLAGVSAIRAGGDTTCAITAGAVQCWGDGGFGQLGNGVAADGYMSAVPVAVNELSGVVDLSVAGANACAALTDGTVRCWGRNASDAWLGFESADCGPYAVSTGDGGPSLATVPCESSPREVPGTHDAVAVVSGGAHNCLRTAGGIARCWGAGHFGQLGDGHSGPDAFHAEPLSVAGPSDVRGLALGASHTCAVVEPDGGVRCWGDNAFGQLGIGTDALDSYKITPYAVTALEGVVDLHAAARTTCAALADGTAVCWGSTATVLPVSPEKGGSALVPTAVPGVDGVVELRTGGGHVCARLDDDTVSCWGQSDRGQLGTGIIGIADFSMEPVPALPLDPPG